MKKVDVFVILIIGAIVGILVYNYAWNFGRCDKFFTKKECIKWVKPFDLGY